MNIDVNGSSGTHGTINGKGVRFWGCWKIIIIVPNKKILRRQAKKMAQASCLESASIPQIKRALKLTKITIMARIAQEVMAAVFASASLWLSLINLELSLSFVSPSNSSSSALRKKQNRVFS